MSASIAGILPAHRRRSRGVLSLAPLVDVTFILLIFFMLVTQFGRLAPIDVPIGEVRSEPQTQRTGASGSRQRLWLTIAADGALTLDGEAVGGLDDLGARLAARLADGDASAEDAQPPLLLVDPDGAVPLQTLIDVMAAVEASPGYAMTLVMRRSETPPAAEAEGGAP